MPIRHGLMAQYRHKLVTSVFGVIMEYLEHSIYDYYEWSNYNPTCTAATRALARIGNTSEHGTLKRHISRRFPCSASSFFPFLEL